MRHKIYAVLVALNALFLPSSGFSQESVERQVKIPISNKTFQLQTTRGGSGCRDGNRVDGKGSTQLVLLVSSRLLEEVSTNRRYIAFVLVSDYYSIPADVYPELLDLADEGHGTIAMNYVRNSGLLSVPGSGRRDWRFREYDATDTFEFPELRSGGPASCH